MLTIARNAEHVDSTAFYDFLGPVSYDVVTRLCEWQGPNDVAAILADIDIVGTKAADIGCGSGAVGAFLKSAGADHVTGVDGSKKMLAGALMNGHIDSMHQCNVAMNPLPFVTDTMDILTASGLMPYLRDPTLLISEMVRASKPGGHVAVSFHPSSSGNTECELLPAGSMRGENFVDECHTVLPNYHHGTMQVTDQFRTAGADLIQGNINERGLLRVRDGRWVPLATMLFRKNFTI